MRPRGATMAYVLGTALGAAVLLSFGFVEVWLRSLATNDFSVIWAGPRILVSGGDPYDPATFRAASDALAVGRSATDVYIYPGWVAVALAPLGALDLVAANIVWTVTGLAVVVVGMYALLRVYAPSQPLVHGLIGFTLLGSEPGLTAFWSGQSTLLLTGGVALMCAALAARRGTAAGIAGSAMLLKPHLFALAGPALVVIALRRGDRRFVYALMGIVLGLVALSALVLPGWWSQWLALVPTARVADVRTTAPPNALQELVGPAGTVIGYGLLAAAIVAALAFGRSRAAVPVWITVSMSASPYLWVYDHIVGVVPLAMAAGLVAERRPRAGDLVAIAGAVVLAIVATLLHGIRGEGAASLAANGIVQLAITAIVLGSLWPLRRAT